jgi:hypothetical protein
MDMSRNLSSDSIDPSKVFVLEEGKTQESVDQENLKYNSTISYIQSKYQRSKDHRRFDEQRWVMAYSNYRGLYTPDVQFLETEKSRVFLKITKQKVHAAYSQISEILFAANKYPIGIEPSPVVDGVEESVNYDPKSPKNMAAQMGAPGPKGGSATVARSDILSKVGPFVKKLANIKDQLEEGPGLTPTAYTWEPAKQAAMNMEKLIHDQLIESDAAKHTRNFVFDMCLFGTGIFKGPFALDKEYPRWNEKGAYDPLFSTTADVAHVPIWDAYPDPDARHMGEAEYFIQRHRLSRTQLRALKNRPGFREKSIEKAILEGANYIREYWEQELNDGTDLDKLDRYEAFEYWGMIDKELAVEAGMTIPDEFENRDSVQVNIWICNNQLLRLVMNPFTPMRIPFYSCPYEINPYSFFGIGIAENMEDTQLIMNGAFRLLVDNAVISSNIIFEIDETNLVQGQSMEITPGKVFRRQGGAPGQAIFGTKFPNVTQECIAIFDKARQLADEATGMPSYAHGQTGITGIGRTASGMSMLMGAAKEGIKSVVRNIDDYLLVPMGKALFSFNMQFNFDKKYLGDVQVVARGTESLMRNEVRSQKLLQFLQIASNPMDAPFVKRDYVLRELAQSLDLEPDKVVNDPREAAIQAKMMQDMQKLMGIDPNAAAGGPKPAAQGGQGNPAGAPKVGDPTGQGGGNIAPGSAPTPNEAGFSASPQNAGPPKSGQGMS